MWLLKCLCVASFSHIFTSHLLCPGIQTTTFICNNYQCPCYISVFINFYPSLHPMNWGHSSLPHFVLMTTLWRLLVWDLMSRPRSPNILPLFVAEWGCLSFIQMCCKWGWFNYIIALKAGCILYVFCPFCTFNRRSCLVHTKEWLLMLILCGWYATKFYSE